MNEIKSVSVFGLGKLGLPIAETIKSRGFNVVGIDIDTGRALEFSGNNNVAYREPHLSVLDTDASFFVVPTPSKEDGSFSCEYLWQAMEGLAVELKRADKRWHLFVCCSTTTPGDCSKLQKMIADTVGQDNFGFCYNPQFVALGEVEKGLLEPDLVLVGESDRASGDLLKDFYWRYNQHAICCMSIISAELTKIVLNSYITTKISFTNQIRRIAEGLGANIHDVLNALGQDTRIGHKYLKPGLSYGGPCFPRDNNLLQYVAEKLGDTAPLALAADVVNNETKMDLVSKIIAQIPAFVVVLGLAYKPGTPVTDESIGLYVASELVKSGRSVLVHDPMASTEGFRTLETLAELRVMTGGLVVVCTDWPEYRNLEFGPGMKVINPYVAVQA